MPYGREDPAITVTAAPAAARLVRHVRAADKVVLAIAALFAGLAAVVPMQAAESVRFVAAALVNLLPFLALSVLVAASVRAMGLDGQIARVFAAHPGRAIVAAALFGAAAPFCSCGVIPIVAALLAAGVPIGPVMAFWIASPLMSPEAFILTSAVFTFDFALARLASAVALGLLAGVATHAMVRRGLFAAPLRAGVTACAACGSAPAPGETRVVWLFLGDAARRRDFLEQGRATGWFLLRWLTLAFLVESLMVAYLPAETVAGWLGGDAWWRIPAGVAVGVPAYLNSYAAIPMVARLVEMGMTPGAALAFLTAGAVTSLPATMSVFALVRVPLFGWYLVLGIVGSLLAGYTLEAWPG